MWDKQRIIDLIESRPAAVNRAVVALHARQTADEKATRSTRQSNGVGFNSADAGLLSYYADWIRKHGGLTGAHLERARKKVRKYAGQLVEIANERERQPQPQGGQW